MEISEQQMNAMGEKFSWASSQILYQIIPSLFQNHEPSHISDGSVVIVSKLLLSHIFQHEKCSLKFVKQDCNIQKSENPEKRCNVSEGEFNFNSLISIISPFLIHSSIFSKQACVVIPKQTERILWKANPSLWKITSVSTENKMGSKAKWKSEFNYFLSQYPHRGAGLWWSMSQNIVGMNHFPSFTGIFHILKEVRRLFWWLQPFNTKWLKTNYWRI